MDTNTWLPPAAPKNRVGGMGTKLGSKPIRVHVESGKTLRPKRMPKMGAKR